MKASHSSSDPLKRLGRKKLRALGRKHKIKNVKRKSAAALRRALRRAGVQPEQIQSSAQKGAHQLKSNVLDPETARRQAELKAYQEHRFRYLYAPSRFAHTGTHAEYLLEKDEELNLPDFYQENDLKILPVDPWQYYLYWDFDAATLAIVQKNLAWEETFILRSYDVTAIAFDGTNAHSSWDAVCHPLVREWYINSPIHDCHVCVELGILREDGFLPLIRSNTVYIPPAGVSSIRRDIFGTFQPRPLDAVTMITETPAETVASPSTPSHSEASTRVAEFFFQPFVPTPVRLDPRPQPRNRIDFATVPRYLPEQMVPWPATPTPALPVSQTHDIDSGIIEPQAGAGAENQADAIWQKGALTSWSESEQADLARSAGAEVIRQTLDLPASLAVRWFSELPDELSPLIFEQWITDPYDQAMFVSYSVWPWEMTEYLPLGASDQIMRKFLGASLFSWFRPGGSERMVRWERFPGASEGARWLRPPGASERAWSGALQPPTVREGSVWHIWPQRPINYSGRGLFV